MNLLQNALNSITNLIKNQEITIITKQIQNIAGVLTDTEGSEVTLISHIQPITPFEIKKVADVNLDLVECYKVYLLENEAKILNSFMQDYENSIVKWGELEFNIFSIKDWFGQNGWLCLYISRVK